MQCNNQQNFKTPDTSPRPGLCRASLHSLGISLEWSIRPIAWLYYYTAINQYAATMHHLSVKPYISFRCCLRTRSSTQPWDVKYSSNNACTDSSGNNSAHNATTTQMTLNALLTSEISCSVYVYSLQLTNQLNQPNTYSL